MVKFLLMMKFIIRSTAKISSSITNKQAEKKPRESIEPDIRERENSSFSFQLHSITVINFKLISQTTSPLLRMSTRENIQFYWKFAFNVAATLVHIVCLHSLSGKALLKFNLFMNNFDVISFFLFSLKCDWNLLQ